MPSSRLTACAAGLLLFGLTGCSVFGLDKTLGLSSDDTSSGAGPGYVVGDEPLAVQTGAAVLSQGGSAADAATAMYFAMAATYPVAAGLGGGGVCLARDPGSSRIETINFLSRDSAGGGAYGIPGNVRGFAVLQQSFGRLPWQRDVAPGEGYATTGFPISKALEERLQASQNVIRLDANLAAEFLNESGALKPVGTIVANPELGATLTAIRIFGPTAFYTGGIAQRLVSYSAAQGGTFRLEEIEGYPVDRERPQTLTVGSETVYLPTVKVGAGAYAGALLSHIVSSDGQVAMGNNAAAAIAGATKATLDQFGIKGLPKDLGATGFAAVDNTGQIVACAVTLNGAFGSGHTAGNTGVILARSPSTDAFGLSGAFLTPLIATAGAAPDAPLVLAGAGAGGPNGTAAMIYALARVALNDDIIQPGHLHSTGLAPYDTINIVACQSDTCVPLPDPSADGLGSVSH